MNEFKMKNVDYTAKADFSYINVTQNSFYWKYTKNVANSYLVHRQTSHYHFSYKIHEQKIKKVFL